MELDDAGNKVTDADFILTIMNGTHGDFVSAITSKQEISAIVFMSEHTFLAFYFLTLLFLTKIKMSALIFYPKKK